MLAIMPVRPFRASPARASLRPIAFRPETPSLEVLLSLVAAGDRAAFERLYDDVADVVFGLARKVVIDRELAREIAQEVLVEVWRKANTYDSSRGSGMTWIAVMTRRRAIDVVRSVEASRRRETAVPDSPPSPDPVGDRVVDREEHSQVRTALDELSTLQRQAIDLAFFGGQTHSQIAETLQLPLGTVKTRIRDGLLRLSQTMSEEPHG